MVDFGNKINNLKFSLTFDDVLIKPRMSAILPDVVDVSVKLNDSLSLDIPVISAAMDTITEYEMARAMIIAGGIAPLHKNMPHNAVLDCVKKLKKEFGENKPYAVAIGVATTEQEIKELHEVGANIFIVDSAHGHSQNIGNLVEFVSKNYPNIFLIAGNVVTAEGAQFLIDKGADAIKVGLGSGSICITRKVTGVGIGQLTAISDVAEVCKKNNVLTIADGGIKSLDEIMKAIVVGADLVMLGYMLSGTNECPGEVQKINNEEYKIYRGMGSLGAMKLGSSSRYNKSNLSSNKWIAEGTESFVKVKGPVKDVLHNIVWGLKTAFGYVGAKTILEVHKHVELIRITNAVLKKSDVHSVDAIIVEKKQ